MEKLIIEHENMKIIWRTLEYEDRMQVNLNNLSIEHMLVEKWDDLQDILINLMHKE